MPRLLVVVVIPESEEEWLRHSEDELCLRRGGYWMSLADLPTTANEVSVTVQMPRSQVFDAEAIRNLMSRAARREPL